MAKRRVGRYPKAFKQMAVERQNLTLRMKSARFHRHTLAFSRKLANLKMAVALYLWSYNFCLIHRSLRMPLQWRQGLLLGHGN